MKLIEDSVFVYKKWIFKNKSAFTLAEVLTTLAIIGIVSALTIPALIQNYQKQQYVTQLKKNYNILQNGFKQIMARDGVMKLTDTKLWSNFNQGYLGWNTSASNETKKNFLNEFSKTFSIISYHSSSITYKYLRGNSVQERYGGFILKDGTIIYQELYRNPRFTDASRAINMPDDVGSFAIDVNGIKKPNVIGRDLFGFRLMNDGSLIPEGSGFWPTYKGQSMHWKTSNSCKTKNTSSSTGSGCAGRIMEEGWKMNY